MGVLVLATQTTTSASETFEISVEYSKRLSESPAMRFAILP